jgi:hypothetical protein
MSQRYQGGFITASYNGLKVPNAPTIGTATAGNLSASVTFTAPSNVGGGAITGYTVISSPGSITGTGTSSPVTVSGLTAGTSYTFTVVATNAYGTGPASAASNSATPKNITSTVEYLVVAGGGGSGRDAAGGGGAGGFRTASGFAVASGSAITVTVGAGGAAVNSGGYASGGRGVDSVFSTITSTGGGGGRARSGDTSTSTGGSGGGGGYGTTAPNDLGAAGNTPSTSPSQGNNGGDASSTGKYCGGGGGASAVGVAGDDGGSKAGNGGAGSASSISGSSVTYAGGGGGGMDHNVSASKGVGGAGGGGDGGVTGGAAGTSGTANTGGGGGGAASNNGNGGSGGSGIVIIRYADTFDAATSTTGSPTITVAGGYRVYQWTGNGSITF